MDVSVSPAQANQTPGIHTNDDTPGPAAFGPAWWGGGGHHDHHGYGVPYDPTHWAVAESSRASSLATLTSQNIQNAILAAMNGQEGRITTNLNAMESRLNACCAETRAALCQAETRLAAGQADIRSVLRDIETKREVRDAETRAEFRKIGEDHCDQMKATMELQCRSETLAKETEISRLKDQLAECNKALLELRILSSGGGALSAR